MLKIVFCFNSGEYRQPHITDAQSHGPYEPQTLVSSDHTSEEDAGYYKFIPPSAVATVSSGCNREQEDMYDHPRDWTLPEVLVTLPSGK